MAHVFISHASEDADEANALVALLEAKGVTAWIAPRDVRPGYDYSIELQQAIEVCTAFVVIVTEQANASPYVRAETEMAFSNSKPMLPVRLAATAAGPGLAFFLKIRNWTDAWGPNREATLARLVLELQTLTGTAPSWAPNVGSAPPEPPAPPPAPPASAPAPPPAPAHKPPAPAPAAPPPLAMVSTPARAAQPNRTRLWLGLGLLGLVALAAALYFLTRRAPVPPWPNPPTNTVVPGPSPVPDRSYANELTDYGILSKSELEANVGSPTPLAIPIGIRLTTAEVQRMLADNRATAIDVLESPHPTTLPGALYMPEGGRPGGFSDVVQSQFAQQLSAATGGDTSRPLIFFCQGASCWESYNAALRANAAGFSQIYWYRGGLAAWAEAALPAMPTPAPYGAAAPGKE